MMFSDLIGRNVLVVEDEYLLAVDIELAMEEHGANVIGPYPDLQGSLGALAKAAVDFAVLDVRLGPENVFELADILYNRKVPFVFVTGYDRSRMPKRFARVPCLSKPVQMDELMIKIASLTAKQAVRH